jgi:pilus assembly protein FimV
VSRKLKNPMKNRVTALAVASALGAVPMMADAAGLGRITVFSALGQPLRA